MNGPGVDAPRARAAAVPRLVNVRRVQRSWARTRYALLALFDIGAAIWATSAAGFSRYRFGLDELPANVAVPGSGRGVSYETLSLFTVLAWILLLIATGTYQQAKRWSLWEQLTGIARAAVGLLALLGIVTMFARLQVSRSFVLVSIGALVAVTALGRVAVLASFRALMRLGIQTDRVLLVGPRRDIEDLRSHLRRTSRHVRVIGELVPDGTDIGRLCTEIRTLCASSGATSVIATDHAIPAGGTRELAATLRDIGITTLVAPGTREVLGPSLHLHAIGDLFLLRVSTGHRPAVQRWLKIVLDRAVALVAVVVFAPVLVVLAIAIRRDGGPALFRQDRIGIGGATFRILKFRTMCPDAEDRLHRDGLFERYVANGFKLPADEDPRITRLGRWLRRTSLDELPQLFNVLGGSMSLVGPRPVVPKELEQYGDLRRAYVSLRPGITGYWQANGRSDVGFPERAVLDSYYYDHQSTRLDIRILARTVGAVLARRGAE